MQNVFYKIKMKYRKYVFMHCINNNNNRDFIILLLRNDSKKHFIKKMKLKLTKKNEMKNYISTQLQKWRCLKKYFKIFWLNNRKFCSCFFFCVLHRVYVPQVRFGLNLINCHYFIFIFFGWPCDMYVYEYWFPNSLIYFTTSLIDQNEI